MKEIKMEAIDRRNNNTTTYETTDKEKIYENLAHALMRKYMSHVNYITKIQRVQNYDGTITIKEYLDNGMLYKYTVEE